MSSIGFAPDHTGEEEEDQDTLADHPRGAPEGDDGLSEGF